MQHSDNATNQQAVQEPSSQPVQRPDVSPELHGKTMLLFGGVMAACCLLPLLLASGLSLAWLTDSPAVGAGILAVLGLIVWRISRKKASCCNDKQASAGSTSASRTS